MKELPPELREELIRYYQTADKYVDRLDSHAESAYEEYVFFVKRFSNSKDRILDLGCGTGLAASMLSRFVGDVVGMDISSISISKAKEKIKVKNLEFICADITKMPFPDESFDIVSSFLTIEHLYDVNRSLLEMVRVVKKGGLIIILSPNLLSPFTEVYRLRDKRNPVKTLILLIVKTMILSFKDIRHSVTFSYRKPVLENRFDFTSDNDAVYWANPVDLKFWFHRKGLQIIQYQNETKWGKVFPSFATGIHIVAKRIK